MGAVLTVMNMKGGVGKTTISIHLAGLAARENLGRPNPSKVLLIDYDPQFNASQAYIRGNVHLQRENDNKTILSVLMDHPNDVNPFSLQALAPERCLTCSHSQRTEATYGSNFTPPPLAPARRTSAAP